MKLEDIKRKEFVTHNNEQYEVVGTRQVDQTVVLWDPKKKCSFTVHIESLRACH